MNSEERFGPKLNMFVCYCSGEDVAFPVSELSRHTRRTNGWQSPKLCEYPQELGFRFEGEVELQNLRILVHESKIPSRIEIFVAEASDEERATGTSSTAYERAVFRRLGHINFCTNEENNFEARELKTVSVRRSCIYLKLIIRKPHTNHINMFGQVGIVAIAPHGHVVRMFRAFGGGGGDTAVGEQEDVALDEMTPDAREAAILEDEAAAAQDVPEGCEGLDAQTAKRVKELFIHKARAVQEEDYDLAKALKTQIDVLKSTGPKIAELEALKKKAVEDEDYDAAKRLKVQIDEIRAQGQGRGSLLPVAANNNNNGGGPYGSLPPNAMSATAIGSAAAAPSSWSAPTASSPHLSPMAVQPPITNSYDERQTGGGGGDQYAAAYDERPAVARMGSMEPQQYQVAAAGGRHPMPSSRVANHDDLPATASGKAGQTIDDIIAEGSGGIVAKTSNPSSATSSASEQPISGNGMAEWEERLNRVIVRLSDDQPRADVLTGAKAQDAKAAQQSFGAYAAACLFSRRWQLREAAVKAISTREGFELLPNPSGAAETLLTYSAMKAYGINDALAAVFFAICDGLNNVLKGSLKGAPSAGSLANGFGNLLPDLLLKAGDNNARVREEAATLLTNIASSEVGSERVAHAALAEPENPSKKPLNHRVHIARVHIVSLLLQEFGLTRKDVRTGLTADSVMTKLVMPALQHSHQDVREGAMSLVLDLYRVAPSIKKYIDELKPAQRSLIEERIGQANGQTSPQSKGRAQVTNKDEPEMVSSSFSVEKGGSNAVLSAARQVAEENNVKKPGGKPAAKPAGKQAAAAKPSQQSAEEIAAKTCQFCDRYDKRFNEDSFHLHYLRTCPMLCPCPLCGQVTEISNLQNHIVSECDHRTLVRQCPLCKEAVRAEDLEDHVAAKQCIPASSQYNVCPLCHAKLTPAGEQGWKQHLLKSPGCVNNPRRFDGGAGEEFQ